MEKFVRLVTKACPLLLANIDTDQILPARFLKLPRSGELGPFEAMLHVKVARGVPVGSELVALRKR